jgi:hypothetical protein
MDAKADAAWQYLFDEYSKYISISKLAEQAERPDDKINAQYHYVKKNIEDRSSSDFIHNISVDHALRLQYEWLSASSEILQTILNGYAPIIRLINLYANEPSYKSFLELRDKHENLMLTVFKIKNYGALIRTPIRTPCYSLLYNQCKICYNGTTSMAIQICSRCTDIRNCTWKYTPKSSKCSCGSSICSWNDRYIDPDTLMNYNPNLLYGILNCRLADSSKLLARRSG